MGLLPTPASSQPLESAYAEAARCSEFVPVWGRPTAFYDFASDLSGGWGETFVTALIRGNAMFPLVHISLIDAGLTLKRPPSMPQATLADSAWRAVYRQGALDIVRAIRPRYLSLGNEVNRWFELHGADSADPNGFQHFVSLHHETYDAVTEL
jgi:hypothetical protein